MLLTIRLTDLPWCGYYQQWKNQASSGAISRERISKWIRLMKKLFIGFVTELARLYQAYADGSSLESVAMKACTVAPILLLQKPSRTSKSEDHVNHLQWRLDLWHKGEILSLICEGKCIQNHLHRSTRQTDDEAISRTFRDIMLQGKVTSALNYLSSKTNGGVLHLDDLVPETTSNGQTKMQSARDILETNHTVDPESTLSIKKSIY